MMKIALCVCTRNRPGDVEKALASVFASTLTPSQIIVSDDSDEAQAAQTCSVCASFSGVTYLRGPRRGLGANRNNCLNHLVSEIQAIAFIDDDVVLRPDFLSKAIEASDARQPKTIVTGGEYKNGTLVTPHNCSFWGHQEVEPRGMDDYHAIVINTTLFPRQLFGMARFDEALRYGSEEIDICAQAEALSYSVRYLPGLCNDHHPSPVNREEYSHFIDASRLYSTYKRYYWLEGRKIKAMVFASLAPWHLIASLCKTGKVRTLPAAFASVYVAYCHIRTAQKRMPQLADLPVLANAESTPCP